MGKGWFGPKTIGWGVSPKSWQGWLVTVLLIAGIAISIRWLGPALSESTGINPMLMTAMISLVWFAVYGAIIWLTYE